MSQHGQTGAEQAHEKAEIAAQGHEARVTAEERELSDKLNKLGAFIHGETFKGLPAEDQRLLQEQDAHMRAYGGVLRQRIARFKGA